MRRDKCIQEKPPPHPAHTRDPRSATHTSCTQDGTTQPTQAWAESQHWKQEWRKGGGEGRCFSCP